VPEGEFARVIAASSVWVTFCRGEVAGVHPAHRALRAGSSEPK
jgi:hypothetical protein